MINSIAIIVLAAAVVVNTLTIRQLRKEFDALPTPAPVPQHPTDEEWDRLEKKYGAPISRMRHRRS